MSSTDNKSVDKFAPLQASQMKKLKKIELQEELMKVYSMLDELKKGDESEQNKSSLKQANKRIKKLESSNKALKRKNASLAKQLKEHQEAEMVLSIEPKFSHAFRLDLYDQNDTGKGNINGKITHLLLQKHTNFKGLDMEKIEAFIRECLTPKTAIQKQKVVGKDIAMKKETPPVQSPSKKTPRQPSPQLKSVDIQPDDKLKKTGLISHNKGFHTWLHFEPLYSSIGESEDLYYQIQVSAFSLENGRPIELNKSELPVLARSEVAVYITPNMLPPGPYRLRVAGKIHKKNGEVKAISEFEQYRFIQVL